MVFLVVFLIVLGVASARGWSVDSRDPDYDLAELTRGVRPWASL